MISKRYFFWTCFVFFSLSLWITNTAFACNRKITFPQGEWREYRENNFIYQYAISGDHTLPQSNQAEKIPDIVMDVALQLKVVQELLSQLHFQLPLESARYGSRGVSHVLVRFVQMKSINGRTFDEPRRLPSGECALIMEIAIHYPSGNLTPAHEFFHLVQYGYTMIKRGWFTEGTARWGAGIIGRHPHKPVSPPKTTQDLHNFWEKTYAAVPVWYGLIEYCSDDPAQIMISENLKKLRYRTGKPVIEDDLVPGYMFMRKVLINLNALSDTITEAKKFRQYGWPQSARNDTTYDPHIWNAIARACIRPLPLPETSGTFR